MKPKPPLTLAPRPRPLVYPDTELLSLTGIKTPEKDFEDAIASIVFDGGASRIDPAPGALPVFRTGRTAGYDLYRNAKMLANLRIGLTAGGTFVIQWRILDGESSWISHHYAKDGRFRFTEGPIAGEFAVLPERTFEPGCPVLNYLYNVAAEEYPKAREGTADSVLLHLIERTLRGIAHHRWREFSASKGIFDPIVRKRNREILLLDRDPVYTRRERAELEKKIRKERSLLLRTKRRIHGRSVLSGLIASMLRDFALGILRWLRHPGRQLAALAGAVVLDPLLWFVNLVRGNLGYSVALAIYSPFTFFFITQPMNPHAMWAVGKVRSAWVGRSEAAPEIRKNTESPTGTSLESIRPQTAGILLASDVPEVATQSWEERMSRFKAMEIAYESDLELAARMGRLEHLETQLNWSIVIESAWSENERLWSLLEFLLSDSAKYQPKFVEFLKHEQMRVMRSGLYLWDRSIRFLLDHPFVLLNGSREQKELDPYSLRIFPVLREMTGTLTKRHPGLRLPEGYGELAAAGSQIESKYHPEGSVLDRLHANSKLFSEADQNHTNPHDPDALRSRLKRQWEILYLLQNRAQESANAGLQMYVWSVRNTAHLLQSLSSAKREEISTLALAYLKESSHTLLPSSEALRRIDSQYEALFHMMVLEFTSIRKELSHALGKDIESIQRQTLIEDLRSFLREREALRKEAHEN